MSDNKFIVVLSTVFFIFMFGLIVTSDLSLTKKINERCMTYHKTHTVEQAREICNAIVKGDSN